MCPPRYQPKNQLEEDKRVPSPTAGGDSAWTLALGPCGWSGVGSGADSRAPGARAWFGGDGGLAVLMAGACPAVAGPNQTRASRMELCACGQQSGWGRGGTPTARHLVCSWVGMSTASGASLGGKDTTGEARRGFCRPAWPPPQASRDLPLQSSVVSRCRLQLLEEMLLSPTALLRVSGDSRDTAAWGRAGPMPWRPPPSCHPEPAGAQAQP